MKQVFTLVALAVASMVSQAAPVAGNPTTYNVPVAYTCVNCAATTTTNGVGGTYKNATVRITNYDTTAAAASGTAGNMGTVTDYTYSNYVNATTVTSNATALTQVQAFRADAQTAINGAVTTYANFLAASTTYLAQNIAAFNSASATGQWTYKTQAEAVADTASGAATVVANIANWSSQVDTAVAFFNNVSLTGFGCWDGETSGVCKSTSRSNSRVLNTGTANATGNWSQIQNASNAVYMKSVGAVSINKLNASADMSNSTGTATNTGLTWIYNLD